MAKLGFLGLGAMVDAVIAMLATPEALSEVLFGADGDGSRVGHRARLIGMSTAPTTCSRSHGDSRTAWS